MVVRLKFQAGKCEKSTILKAKHCFSHRKEVYYNSGNYSHTFIGVKIKDGGITEK